MQIRRITDHLASGVIKGGGVLLIVVVLGIITFIAFQTFPLWESASIRVQSEASVPSIFPATQGRRILMVGEEEQRQIQYVVTDDRQIYAFSASDLKPKMMTELMPVHGTRLTAANSALGAYDFAVTTDAGELVILKLRFSTLYEDSGRVIVPEIASQKTWHLNLPSGVVTSIHFAPTDDGYNAAGILARGDSSWAFAAPLTADSLVTPVILGNRTDISVLTMSHHGGEVAYGTRTGEIGVYSMDNLSTFRYSTIAATREITALEYMLGDVTLLVADESGSLRGWMPVQSESGRSLTAVHDFGKGDQPIGEVRSSWRNKCLLTADQKGTIRLFHLTSQRLLAEIPTHRQVDYLCFSPKADGALVLDTAQDLVSLDIANRHPESTIKTLFGTVWYESYNEPGFTWQSSGGTDDFEPKLSLVPLIFGTLKGTVYAMLFAVPLAILGALYTAQFAHPKIRAIVKPTVEIMAALPSVVIGFLAGLWLAPIMEQGLVAFLLMCVMTPVIVVAFYALFARVPVRWTGYFANGREMLFLIPILLLTLGLSYGLGNAIESSWMGGNVSNWLREALGINYDQRNCIVVGIAMAFAVMPIIFTIAEDSLTSVPAHLTSASLALGATRWQTAIKVVLPAASAGIFSAVMIGFGRAVGETMIVLMATGNTPIMDWSIFNGMRTLSANIAVEIPEAPHGGTLYRVLFLSGAILFMMTFVVNTLAEMVRQRLRKKYASM